MAINNLVTITTRVAVIVSDFIVFVATGYRSCLFMYPALQEGWFSRSVTLGTVLLRDGMPQITNTEDFQH